ncbi:hypothetical protein B6S44_24870 [Bosea sp. Tri-44]|nr:hypothetical protein B6S44_24870 [Bosea sp. Tri-44]
MALGRGADIPNLGGGYEFALRYDALTAEEVDEGPQCRGDLATNGIIEVEARTIGAPFLEHTDEPAVSTWLRTTVRSLLQGAHSKEIR